MDKIRGKGMRKGFGAAGGRALPSMRRQDSEIYEGRFTKYDLPIGRRHGVTNQHRLEIGVTFGADTREKPNRSGERER